MFSVMRLAMVVVATGHFFLSVQAHGALTEITGANGVTAAGFGILASTPRDGTRRNPFQQDTSIIKDRDIARGETGVCGETIAGGNNNVAAQMTAAVAAGLPEAAPDGTISMTIHQINGDGAGPYKCDISADGTGADFVPATVTTNVPGVAGLSRARATGFPLVVQMPAAIKCAGGPDGNACLIRCRNPRGPFGGCAAIANNGGATPQGNNTAAADTSEDLVDAEVNKRRAVVSRVVGAGKSGKWI